MFDASLMQLLVDFYLEWLPSNIQFIKVKHVIQSMLSI